MSELTFRLFQISEQAPQILLQHTVEPMFTRIGDDRGGYHEHFDSDWKRIDKDSRSLVYQSRAVWVASACADLFPDLQDDLKKMAEHGLDWLANQQWDEEQGGFFWSVNLEGKPTARSQEEKHGYGQAFAIYALAEMARVFDNSDALTLAIRAFSWYDHNARDRQNRGYHESLHADGTPYRPDGHPEVRGKESWVETSRGYRTFNTHLHLLEAFSTLVQIWPEPTVEQRIAEILGILKTKMYVDPGCFHGHYTPDWRPIPGEDSYGHDVEAAFLMLEAAGLSEDADPLDTADKSRRIVDHVIDLALDRDHGGIYYSGDAFHKITNDNKIWWAQAEALNAFATLHSLFGTQTDHYAEAIVNIWDFVTRHQLDQENKGWYPTVTPDGRPLTHQKLDPWTEGYHQTRALINLHRLLAPDHTIGD